MMAAPQFTPFAEVYSHPRGRVHKAIAGIVPYKSGLTPLFFPFPTEGTAADVRHVQRLEDYQILHLKGFTADQLRILETLAITHEASPSDIITLDCVPVHPIFDKPRWMVPLPKHLAQYPLGLGRPGYWNVENDLVWDVLKPALQLASQAINNIHTWPWFEALLDLGCYDRIPASELPPGHKTTYLERFKLRSPHLTPPSHGYILHKMTILSQGIQFNIASGVEDGRTEHTWGSTDGLTDERQVWQHTICNISYQLLEPLIPPMNGKITPPERAVCHFQIAMTILHEFTHGLWDQLVPHEHKLIQHQMEPYFEDEPMSELGLSIENAVFGGTDTRFTKPIGKGPRGLPPAGIFCSDAFCWPMRRSANMDQPYFVENYDSWWEITYFPIPITYFMNLHNPFFWRAYVKAKGSEALHMGPKTFGSRYMFDQDEGGMERYGDLIHHPDCNQGDAIISKFMTIEEQTAVVLENTRRRDAKRVANALVGSREERQRSEKLMFGCERHELLNTSNSDSDFDTNDGAAMPQAPSTYKYPRYDPGIGPFYDQVRELLICHRQELALDSLYFDIAEHMLLEYIHRLGLDIKPEWWRGFLLECERKEELFKIREVGAPPTSTTLMIRRYDIGWPTDRLPPRGLWGKLQANYPDHTKGPYPLIEAFDYGTHKAMEDDKSMFGPPSNRIDFDKSSFRFMTNRALKKYAPECGRLEEWEFDACIDYYEVRDQKWLFGPPGIIRKSENGWDDSDAGSPVLLDNSSSSSSSEGDSDTLKGEEGDFMDDVDGELHQGRVTTRADYVEVGSHQEAVYMEQITHPATTYRDLPPDQRLRGG